MTAASPRTVLFRADASAAMGTGHVMRDLALAEEVQARGGICHFAVASCPPPIQGRLEGAGMRVHRLRDGADPGEIRRLLRTVAPDLAVVDGYHFKPAYRAQIHAEAGFTLALDDQVLEPPLHADMILNSHPTATPDRYPGLPRERLLLGLAYVPLRREFRIAAPDPPAPLAARTRMLVNLGGSDPLGLTGPLAQALDQRLPEGVGLELVVGGGSREPDRLRRLSRSRPHGRIRVHVATSRMAALMARAGLALVAAGSTLWELAAMEVPAVALVVADNQAPALQPPLAHWFCPLDARSDRQIVPRAAERAAELWRDPGARGDMARRLAGLDLGGGSARICDALARALALSG